MTQPADSIHVTDTASVTTLRQTALSQVAMVSGSVVESVVSSPLGSFTGLGTVRKLTATCSGLVTYPHLYEAANHNGHLVIVHQGHGGTHESFGTGELIRTLIGLGCDVLVIVMIGGTSTTSGNAGNHAGSQLWQHLSQIKASLDYTLTLKTYSHVGMTGISGGGWATVVYAGLDSRITKSVSVAGYLPLYMTGISRDDEQFAIGNLATSYLDLAILAASNGRHVQLLHTHDDCCFNAAHFAAGADYEPAVMAKAIEVGGAYSLRWVTQTPHEISTTDRSIITSELGLTNMPNEVTLPHTSITLVGPVGPSNVPDSSKWVYWSGQGYAHAAGDGSRTATWQHTATGEIAIAAKWGPYSNRATNTKYQIFDGTTLKAEVLVNQELSPSPGPYQPLGTWTFADSVRVVVNNLANEYVMADELRLTISGEVPPPPPPPPVADIETELQKIESSVAAIRSFLSQ